MDKVKISGINTNSQQKVNLLLVIIILTLLILMMVAGIFVYKRGFFDSNVNAIIKSNEIQKEALVAVDTLYTIFDFKKENVTHAIVLKQKDIDDLKENSGGFLDNAAEGDYVITIKVSDNAFLSVLYNYKNNRILNIEWAVIQGGTQSEQTNQ